MNGQFKVTCETTLNGKRFKTWYCYCEALEDATSIVREYGSKTILSEGHTFENRRAKIEVLDARHVED